MNEIQNCQIKTACFATIATIEQDATVSVVGTLTELGEKERKNH